MGLRISDSAFMLTLLLITQSLEGLGFEVFEGRIILGTPIQGLTDHLGSPWVACTIRAASHFYPRAAEGSRKPSADGVVVMLDGHILSCGISMIGSTCLVAQCGFISPRLTWAWANTAEPPHDDLSLLEVQFYAPTSEAGKKIEETQQWQPS